MVLWNTDWPLDDRNEGRQQLKKAKFVELISLSNVDISPFHPLTHASWRTNGAHW
jgi:hypothetical protein